jgi:hypothetical protein
LHFNFALENTIKRVQINKDDWKLNGTHLLLIYSDDINLYGGSVHTIEKKVEIPFDPLQHPFFSFGIWFL